MHEILNKKESKKAQELEKAVYELIDAHNTEAAIFDIDGTLYDLKRLHRLIYFDIAKYLIWAPLKRIKEIRTLQRFIHERETRVMESADDLEKAQYEWAATKSASSAEVRAIVEKWIYQKPLKHIYRCRKKETIHLFHSLSKRGLIVAVYSDYPTKEKLKKLGLSPARAFCATDKEINKLKPNPRGLEHICETIGVPARRCLMIGDRDDRDGECARQAGAAYFILK